MFLPKGDRVSRSQLKASLRLWRRRLAYRERRLRVSERHHRPNSVAKWRKHAERAQLMVKRRERQLRENRPMREKAASIMVNWAHESVREQGGNNRGPRVDGIIKLAGGTPGEPWCGDAVAAAYILAGSKSVTRAWAYVPTLERVLTRVLSPRRGHVVIFNFDGGVPDHTGLFLRDNRDGTYLCVEGNTRPGSSASDAGGGEGVYLRTRPKSQVQSVRRVLR